MPTAGVRQGGPPPGIGIMKESRKLLTTCSAAALLLIGCESVSYAQAQAPAPAETPAPAATPAPAPVPSTGSGELPAVSVQAPRQTQIQRRPPPKHVVT